VPIAFLAAHLAARARLGMRIVTLGAVLAVLAVSVAGTEKRFASQVATAAEDEELNRAVRALPLEAAETRLWAFKVNAPEYLVGFLATLVNSPGITAFYQERFPVDRMTTPWMNWDVSDGKDVTPIADTAWRYAVLDESWLGAFGYQRFPMNEENGRARVVLSNSHLRVLERTE
jgi:hypothetical protein